MQRVFASHARATGRRSVPRWGTCVLIGIVSVAMVIAFGTAAHAEPGDGARGDTMPGRERNEEPRRIPGEGVQEDPPQVEDDRDERKAAPSPDIDGCPYRGRTLELIV